MFKALFTAVRSLVGFSTPTTTHVTFNNCNFQIGMLGGQQLKKGLDTHHSMPHLTDNSQEESNDTIKSEKN